MNVILKKPHRHAGTHYAIGDVIDVNNATAQWLARNGIITEHQRERDEPATTTRSTKPKFFKKGSSNES
jgi:hypothetical protein